MDRTPDVSDFNYEEEEGGGDNDNGENDDNGNEVYDESMLQARRLAFYAFLPDASLFSSSEKYTHFSLFKTRILFKTK